MEYVRDIPYGLAVCHLDGEQASVLALSDAGLIVRCGRRPEGRELSVHFLREGGYGSVAPADWRVQSLTETRLGLEAEILVQDPAYRAMARTALALYAAHVRSKLAGEEFVTDGAISPSLAAQKEVWFRDAMEPPAGTWEFALSLDRPGWYEAFLQLDAEAFRQEYLCQSRLYHHRIFHRPVQRLYVGNAFCQDLFPSPDQFRAIGEKAAGEGLKVTVVLPTARERAPLWAAEKAEETMVNDWGTLRDLRGRRLLLGALLNRRRKDPRLADAAGLAENSLNDPLLRDWLTQMGVVRYEYEACGYVARVAQGRHSLHLPFYQTNTSHACALRAACRDGAEGGCAGACERYARLYPDDMGLVGRYNSIYALDRRILTDRSALSAWLAQGVDRIVLEGLS